MLKLASRVLALTVAAIVLAAVFVAVMAVWSWWAPAEPMAGDATAPRTPLPIAAHVAFRSAHWYP